MPMTGNRFPGPATAPRTASSGTVPARPGPVTPRPRDGEDTGAAEKQGSGR